MTATADTVATVARLVPLRDWRFVAVHEFGDPTGRPVVFAHGGGLGATGLFAQTSDRAAREHGLRLLAPDRPGLGDSSPRAGRKVLDWPGDVVEVAHQLELDTLDVVSHSGGAAYALALACAAPERVLSLSLVSPMAPKRLILSCREIPVRTKLNLSLNAAMPGRVLGAMSRRIAAGMERDPQRAAQTFLHRLLLSEQRSLMGSAYEKALPRCVDAALRQGTTGVVEDLRLIFGHWGFDLRSATAPLRIWHGGCDSTSPPQVARMLAREIPQAELRVFPDEGHLSTWLSRAPDILAAVAGRDDH
ncbi:MAG: alpha/beta hydrolase [Thermoleophilia bacterium]|nr:alpha/beta hydrolase [Thermoleophilia bacterium]